MNLTTAPSPPLKGTLTLPGDKSLSHRVALFAALAEGESRIENFLVAGVTKAMLDALEALGVDWHLEKTTLTVRGRGLLNLKSPAKNLDCGNSATTMRLLAGAIAASEIHAVLDGSTGLRRRPMNRIVEPLKKMGFLVNARDGKAPLTFAGKQDPVRLVQPAEKSIGTPPVDSALLDFHLPVASAQVKTCLLLAALALPDPTTIVEPGPSRDHSERLLSSMGVSIVSHPYAGTGVRTTISPDQPSVLSPIRMTLPGDISSAAFLIVAALITPGSEITLKNVGLNPTRTGLLDALLAMGARLEIRSIREIHNEPLGDITVCYSDLQGIEVSGPLVVRMIDEFPAFAVAAAYASGKTRVREAGELRHKESDRITALCRQLEAVGVAIEEQEDGFEITGDTPPAGGQVDPHGDHRLAMSLAIAGLGARAPIVLQSPAIIQESFPGFKAALEYLGANID